MVDRLNKFWQNLGANAKAILITVGLLCVTVLTAVLLVSLVLYPKLLGVAIVGMLPVGMFINVRSTLKEREEFNNHSKLRDRYYENGYIKVKNGKYCKN